MREILANHGRRIQGRVIITSDWIVEVKPAFWRQHDCAFISGLTAVFIDDGHQRILLAAFHGDITREFDTLAAHDKETDRDATNLRHLGITGDNIDFVHQVVDEVTILNTVFRDNRAFFRAFIRHPENILGAYIVFGETPAHHCFHVGCCGPLDGEACPRRRNRDHFELMSIFVEVGGMVCLFELDEIADFKTEQVAGKHACSIGGGVIFHVFHCIADEVTRDVV